MSGGYGRFIRHGLGIVAAVLLVNVAVFSPVLGYDSELFDEFRVTCRVVDEGIAECDILLSNVEYTRICDSFDRFQDNISAGHSLQELCDEYQQILVELKCTEVISQKSYGGLLRKCNETLKMSEVLCDKGFEWDAAINISAFNLLGLVVGNTNNTQFFSRLHEIVMIASVSLVNFMGWYVQMVLRLLTNERLLLAFVMIVLGFAFFAVWGWVEVITQGFFTIWFHKYVWFHEDEQRLMLWNTVLWGSPGWMYPYYKEYGNGSVTTVGLCGVKTWSGWFTGMMRGFSGVILSRGDEEYSYRYCGMYGAAVKGE